MPTSVIVFPGQGGQFVGQGAQWADENAQIAELFDLAEQITKLPIKKLCFQGPINELSETKNLQPAILT
ncbi:MAG: malonyl CoA-acyl carrier protein transacylase, partial [Deltaproteobacteria bacterium]|nr:malonyl CoA-acyl carrier protein transacylase [Deltaproteobacteria bacterium]